MGHELQARDTRDSATTSRAAAGAPGRRCEVRRLGAFGPLRSLDVPARYPERTVSFEPDVIAICFGWLLRGAIRRTEEPFRVRSEGKGNSHE
jgi:hypothetical protein